MTDILKLYKVATKAAYDSIKVKSANNLYFVEKYDNGPALFKGEKRYTVSKEELDNILKGYSKTVHKHNPADINLNSSNRFVTDTEKGKWNTASTNATNTKKIVENIKMSGSTTSLLKNGEIIIPTIAGPKGAKGDQGDTGAAGKDGFNPYWKTTGSTILVANNGERDLKGAKGAKGDTGIQGPQGLKGDRGDIVVNDTRNTNEPPSFYFKSGRGGNWEFKLKSTLKVNTTALLGTGGTYCTLQTIIPWNDKSGGYPMQIAYDNQSNLHCKRVGTSDTTWGAWELMKGSKGDRGPQGAKGDKGNTGAKGATGAAGKDGAKGDKGDTGSKGATGAKGKDGFNPYWKTTGSTILVANNGERDLKGPKGDTGAKGDTGPKGAIGAKGTTGATGAKGKDGFNPYWKTTGSTILVANNGERDLKGPKGDTGAKGADGARGPQGLKGDTGPKGDTGAKGADGARGPQGPKGDTGAKGADGARGARGPQGPKGDTGASGKDGGFNNINVYGHSVTGTTTTIKDTVSNIHTITATSSGVLKIVSSTISATGSINAVKGFFQQSDIRLKDNIKNIDNSKINEIDLKSFVYKNSDNKQHYGVIAQELELIYPELVSTNEDGYKSVNYVELLILEASRNREYIKKLEDRIALLEEKIK